MEKPELLAPAKNLESMKKVINQGADSIYMGYSKFNARMFGKNFSVGEFKDGIIYAHERGVQVYLTLNTLIKEHEIEEAVKLATQAVEDGVDGILIQDLGLALIIQKRLPEVPLHASTQMSISNHYGVAIIKALGFSRVVLAREISSTEIIQLKQIIAGQHGNIEVEAFIHGGLCIAFSGQCFASSYFYKSSANRGLCKMPCWENFVFTENDSILYSGNLIRPKDLCGLSELKHLIDGGVDCLKIQGRLRNETYISEIVDVYRKCINDYKSNSIDNESFKEYEERLQINSPRGLTQGNLSVKIEKSIIIEDDTNSEKVEDVSEKRIRYEEDLGELEIETSSITCSKAISIFLHQLNENYSYFELTQEISKVYIPYREFLRTNMQDILINICNRFDTYIYMPPMIYERNCEKFYIKISDILERYYIKGIVLSNISDFILIEQFKDKNIKFNTGNHVHVMNSLVTEMLKGLGVNGATLSLELSPNEASFVVKKSILPLEQIVYGHPELMHMKYCLYRKQNECGDCTVCMAIEKGKRYFLKGKDNIFEVLLFPEQTESVLYSTKILSVSPDEWVGDSVRMDFLWETPQEINEVISLMREGHYYSGRRYLQKIEID